LAPTGSWIAEVGRPVSWQMAPAVSTARSIFWAMIVSAWDERLPSGSAPSAVFIAARTSGGRSVEVRTMSWSTLSKKEGDIRAVYWLGAVAGGWEDRIKPPGSSHQPPAPMKYRTERDP